MFTTDDIFEKLFKVPLRALRPVIVWIEILRFKDEISRSFGRLIDSIELKSILVEESEPKIKNAEYIASYNWLDGQNPVILVPGSPPAWTPPVTPSRLKEDSQEVFRDINAAKYASFPLEPAIRSLQAMRPQFNLLAVDLVGCGSTLGNLLRFAGSEQRPFRLDVDVVGETVFFVRKENSPTELITGLRGYGHTFPEAYTTWDPEVRKSCSHQRVVQYKFGGLSVLLRSETDGYLRASTPTISVQRMKSQAPVEDEINSLAMNTTTPSNNQKLVLEMKGRQIPQTQIFDLKTRASYKQYNMDEILPRLWLNQTPNFVLAYHDRGLFVDPETRSVRQEIMGWERTNAALLSRFHAIIKRVIDVVRDLEPKQCEISWDGDGPLRITSQLSGGSRALPSDLIEHYEALL